MNIDSVVSVLKNAGYSVEEPKRYSFYAYRIKLDNGVTVFCGDKGSIWYKGNKENMSVVSSTIDSCYKKTDNNKVFIVYGRDLQAKQDLEAMIESFGVEPLAIDNLPTQGLTIIEKLEKYIADANYGIVLATPDDIGYIVNHEDDKKYRARQNVILEMGMLFSKLSRKRVAIIIKKCEGFEKPSDIDGLIYYEYKDSIYELRNKIRSELNANGYSIK